MQDGMQELFDILKRNKICQEIVTDIKDIEDLIENNSYDKSKVIGIESKYSIETKFLMDLEELNKIGFENNYDDPDLQVLLNLRERLYRIGVYKILKENGKEITKEVVSNNYYNLIKLLEK